MKTRDAVKLYWASMHRFYNLLSFQFFDAVLRGCSVPFATLEYNGIYDKSWRVSNHDCQSIQWVWKLWNGVVSITDVVYLVILQIFD